ncbi:NUDIX hydrolase [Halorussus halophilus]|uniref:NUDIX hydrolase n=1 Tax=Halorussus halophilus TaxID=2650975 RepID=UPI001300E981|nr:NUDIX hydrolase [Halorussus halophilus]
MTTFPANFCPDCATPLTDREIEGRERQYCDACDRVVWRNPVPTAGVAVVGDDGVLLTERAVEPGVGKWAVPGGHLEVDESPEEAAVRELREETGVEADPDALELLDTFTAEPFDGKRIVSIGFVVKYDDIDGAPHAGPEVSSVGWFTPDSFAAFDGVFLPPHDRRFERAWERLG